MVGDISTRILSGTLRTLDFGTFEKLDPDWARKDYFESTQPTFWIRADEFAHLPLDTGPDEAIDRHHQDGMLIFNALLALTGRLYPDPRLSMAYRLQRESYQRYIGPFERTWLLKGGGLQLVSQHDLQSVAALTERWHAYGFKHNDAVFAPLRGLASLASTFMSPALGILPLAVSLEGFLLPRKVSNIAKHMAKVMQHLLAQQTPADISEFMAALYDVRSRMVHGERILNDEASRMTGRLQQLTGNLVVAVAAQVMERGVSSQALNDLRKDWLPS